YGFGASATKAGLYLLPSSVVLLFAGPIAGLVGRRLGFKWPLALGMLLVAAASGSFAAFHDRPWELLAAMPALGIGVGFAFAAMATLIVEAVRPEETGVATGMNTVMRTVGGVIGGQVGAALLTAYTLRRTTVPSVTGYEATFAVSAAAALVGAVVAVLVTSRARRAPVGAGVSVGAPAAASRRTRAATSRSSRTRSGRAASRSTRSPSRRPATASSICRSPKRRTSSRAARSGCEWISTRRRRSATGSTRASSRRQA